MPRDQKGRSSCECGRNSPHLHYSRNHDLFLRMGLVSLLLAWCVGVVQLFVKNSTSLELSEGAIHSYEEVAGKIAASARAYEYLVILAAFETFAVVLLAIVAVWTLHSIDRRRRHLAAITGNIVFSLGRIATMSYHSWVNAQILASLRDVVSQAVLDDALQVEEALEQAYGFWGVPADFLVVVLLFVSLGLFLAGLATIRPFTLWEDAGGRGPHSAPRQV